MPDDLKKLKVSKYSRGYLLDSGTNVCQILAWKIIIFMSRIKCRFVAQFPWEIERNYFSSLKDAVWIVAVLSRKRGFMTSAAFLFWKLLRVKRLLVYETGTQFLAFVMSVIVGGTTAQPAFFLAEIGLSELARNGKVLACVVSGLFLETTMPAAAIFDRSHSREACTFSC